MIILPKTTSQDYLEKMRVYVRDFRNTHNSLFEDILEYREKVIKIQKAAQVAFKVGVAEVCISAIGFCFAVIIANTYKAIPCQIFMLIGLAGVLGLISSVVLKFKAEKEADIFDEKYKELDNAVKEAELEKVFDRLNFEIDPRLEYPTEQVREIWEDPCIEDEVYKELSYLEYLVSSNIDLECTGLHKDQDYAKFDLFVNGYKTKSVLILCDGIKDFSILTKDGEHHKWDFSYLEKYAPFYKGE